MPKWRVEFIEDVVEKRAHAKVKGKNSTKSGVREVKIPKGTVREVNDSSLNHWNRKGVVKVLGQVEDQSKKPAVGFGAFKPQDTGGDKPMTKTELRAKLTEAAGLFKIDDVTGVTKIVGSVDKAQAEELLAELNDDSLQVFLAGVTDAQSGSQIASLKEFHEALLDAEDTLLPPSRRRRNAARSEGS